MFHLNNIFIDLSKAKEELILKQVMVLKCVERARMNTEVIEKGVQKWLKNVNQVMADVHTIENKVRENKKSCNDWCPNWIGRYKLSKEATHKRQLLLKSSILRAILPRLPIVLQLLA